MKVLSKQAEELDNIADRTTTKTLTIGKFLRQTSQDLSRVSEEVLGRVDRVGDGLEQVGTSLQGQAGDLGEYLGPGCFQAQGCR